jgi:hypothetical protein
MGDVLKLLIYIQRIKEHFICSEQLEGMASSTNNESNSYACDEYHDSEYNMIQSLELYTPFLGHHVPRVFGAIYCTLVLITHIPLAGRSMPTHDLYAQSPISLSRGNARS